MNVRDFIAIMVNASTNIGSAMEMMTAVITVTNCTANQYVSTQQRLKSEAKKQNRISLKNINHSEISFQIDF